ncbi:hypothetical protein ASPZODRAFT_15712 [Penicilliopsis zonata CBS 506.65]|uniref:Mitochondrial intermembrane space import and assembly protein 40 n=1 Tax=Penicilliopsis zonata CBS 506.65 TaxID=1073090 RepID=A0A1L9SIQ1_9EURO|nr:hypothetical protein ASPZODRAFT_15712 [Penicilliopsis zonata CBS 506.65]OJJ47027.1 hypothetical protein ASPZODRAFT_15712 [Penicilliopsis zonata CBS 506.65]
MFRPAVRAVLRAPGVAVRAPVSRRFIGSSGASEKSRSWKNTALRFGLAGGAIYYYNTSSIFAEESFLRQKQRSTESAEELPTLDSIKPKIRQETVPEPAQPALAAEPALPEIIDVDATQPVLEGGLNPEALEQEASQEAAFNPETGEINWDCPCLGGMAHGPCGEDFKAAFSCFVFSQEEPKGIDCIEKFKAMQDCFRQYPEVYGAELEDDEAAAAAAPPTGEEESSPAATAAEIEAASSPDEKRAHAKEVHAQAKAEAVEKSELAESEALVPKAVHDDAQLQNRPTEK